MGLLLSNVDGSKLFGFFKYLNDSEYKYELCKLEFDTTNRELIGIRYNDIYFYRFYENNNTENNVEEEET